MLKYYSRLQGFNPDESGNKYPQVYSVLSLSHQQEKYNPVAFVHEKINFLLIKNTLVVYLFTIDIVNNNNLIRKKGEKSRHEVQPLQNLFEIAAAYKNQRKNKINTTVYHIEEFDKIVCINFLVFPINQAPAKFHLLTQKAESVENSNIKLYYN